jgi:hypothetical protein
MKRVVVVPIVLVTAAAAVVTIASASSGATRDQGSRTIGATLSSKQAVPPAKGATSGSGKFTATGPFSCKAGEQNCTRKAGKLEWKLTFSGLSGPALLAHLHLGKKGVAGPVAISLCGPCPPGAHGTIFVGAKLFAVIEAGGVYVNVHTKKNPAGEIRGQVKPISAIL